MRSILLLLLGSSACLPLSPSEAQDGPTTDPTTGTATEAGRASKPPLSPADYGRWERFGWGAHALAPDGRWLAYPVERVRGDFELRVTSLDGTGDEPEGTERILPDGEDPRFSNDSKHLLWTVSLSEEERERRERDGESTRTGAGVLELAGGEPRTFEEIERASFDKSGRYLALIGFASEDSGEKGGALRVIDLETDAETSLGQAVEYAWSDRGSWLAFVVQTGKDEGNGVQLYDAETGRLTSLDRSGSSYRGLAWRGDATDLAFFRSTENASEEGQEHVVLAWLELEAGRKKRFELDAETPGVPPGLQIVAKTDLVWSKDRPRLFFGLREAPAQEDESEDDLPGLQIWHADDVRILPAQETSEAWYAGRALQAAWNLEANSAVQIGTDLMERTILAREGQHALERVSARYPWGTKFGRPFHDVWSVDLENGERNRVLERVRYTWGSPGARYVLSFDGEHFHCLDLETDRRVVLTEDLSTGFADREYDTPTDMLPPYGVGGWLAQDAGVLLYDRYDVWRIAPDGSSSARLTRGAEEQLRHRIEDLDPDEEAFDPERPLYFSTWNEWSEQRGYARLVPGAEQAEGLFLLDKRPGRLTQAEGADTYVFTLQACDDSEDFFVSDGNLTPSRQISETNPFQDEYAWTRAELVEFESEAGVALQAALYYPVNHEPTRAYPIIVWTYEKETPGVHTYRVPSERDYYNFTAWTQAGYFVMLMDIAYRPRDPGVCAIEAVRPAIGKVVERKLVDPERVGLIGHSWGGYQAAYLPTRTKLFAASVAGAPLTDFVSFMGQIHWNSGTAESDHWETGQARMEVPYWEDPEAHERNSPLHGIEELETPILLAHGDEDGVVEFFQSTVFYNFARRAEKPVVLLAYEGEDHGFRTKANQIDYHRRILEWFGHYLKDEPAPDWIRSGLPLAEQEQEMRRVAQASELAPEVGLEHFYAVLDAQTFSALAQNPFLMEEFASVDAGLPGFETPTREDSALYIRGKDTYLELFGPENPLGAPIGQVGIGLGVDDPGRFSELEDVWRASFAGSLVRSRKDWSAGTERIAWREVLGSADTLSGPDLVLRAGMYAPEFLPWLYPDRSENENGIARADFLEPLFAPDRLLENVTGLVLALEPETRGELARQLEAIGYESTQTEGALLLEGGDWKLTLVEPGPRQRGLVALEMVTTADKEGARVVPLGPRSMLVFGPEQSAVWSFLR